MYFHFYRNNNNNNYSTNNQIMTKTFAIFAYYMVKMKK